MQQSLDQLEAQLTLAESRHRVLRPRVVVVGADLKKKVLHFLLFVFGSRQMQHHKTRIKFLSYTDERVF